MSKITIKTTSDRYIELSPSPLPGCVVEMLVFDGCNFEDVDLTEAQAIELAQAIMALVTKNAIKIPCLNFVDC